MPVHVAVVPGPLFIGLMVSSSGVVCSVSAHAIAKVTDRPGGVAPPLIPPTLLYVLGARLAAGIADLRGYDVHSEEVRSAILVYLLGSGASRALSAAGVEIGQKSAIAALRKVPGRVLIDLNRRVGFRLVTRAGTTGTINLIKLAPLAGAPIGATVDGLSCRAIGKYAKHAFPQGM